MRKKKKSHLRVCQTPSSSSQSILYQQPPPPLTKKKDFLKDSRWDFFFLFLQVFREEMDGFAQIMKNNAVGIRPSLSTSEIPQSNFSPYPLPHPSLSSSQVTNRRDLGRIPLPPHLQVFFLWGSQDEFVTSGNLGGNQSSPGSKTFQ